MQRLRRAAGLDGGIGWHVMIDPIALSTQIDS
jgi:hypothetical protein